MPSIFPFDPSDLETFTVVANPIRTYTSSSTQGSTGSVHVYPRRSTVQKDVQPDSSFIDSTYDDSDLSAMLQSVQEVASSFTNGGVVGSITASLPQVIDQYMQAAAAQPQSQRLTVALDPVRFVPPTVFDSDTLRKLVIKDQLNTFYRTTYPTAHWAYTNYHTLNFFTASSVPSDSVLLYPNIPGGKGNLVYHAGFCSGTYTPSGSFTFDFHINPRYQQDQAGGQFKAGTILHLSSTFALSLVSGSGKDVNGRTSAFRLQLQLSRSADVPPSWVAQDAAGAIHVSGPSGSYTHVSSSLVPPFDLIFLSNDNVLLHNHWHHVVVRWGTDAVNRGMGTFNVDGVDVGTFFVPSASITPSLVDIANMLPADHAPGALQQEPTVLCLGNFYEGPNNTSNPLAGFFGTDPATRDGLNALWTPGVDAPGSFSFDHPLNAELHDIAIRRRYLSDADLASSASVGPTFLDKSFAFFVPPFFVEQSPYRTFVGDHGGILLTPFQEINGATDTPFNVGLSFGVAGHYINLENFVKDLGAQSFPRLHHLTGVAIQSSTAAQTCNEFLYAQPFVTKRNLSVLPCDDGLFVPSFQLLVSEGLARAVDDLGIDELSFISLDDMVMTGTLLFGPGTFDDGSQPTDQINSFAGIQLGATPETPFAAAGPAIVNHVRSAVSGTAVDRAAPLTIYQRTQDPSSNQLTVFDISNLYYGFRISPGTVIFRDPDLLGSSLLGSTRSPKPGPVSLTLADDGRGNIYRADCLTSQSSWNSVGNVYYDEGLVVVKSPHAYFFGQQGYSMDLRGEQHVHVMRLDAIAPNNQLNSSSNPTYQKLPLNGYPNDFDDSFVYITGINFHDSDLNVVMKASLAQPISKRSGDRLLFKVRMDM